MYVYTRLAARVHCDYIARPFVFLIAGSVNTVQFYNIHNYSNTLHHFTVQLLIAVKLQNAFFLMIIFIVSDSR